MDPVGDAHISREKSAADSSPAYAWYVVLILVLAYILAYVDRQILTLLVQPIKASLGISDVQISLLHGFAFAIFYTFLGIPIARLADRYRRLTIISVGIAIWSAMTALCGLSHNFTQLFMARIGVGIGEATLSPAAYSILADYFPARSLARAMSVYTGAIYVGAGIALIAGGALIGLVEPMTIPGIGEMEPWQTVFLIVAAPGLLISALISSLREPMRRGVVAEQAFPSLREVAAYVGARWRTYGSMILGLSVASLMWNGVTGWIATFFIRSFAWTPAEVGLRYGLAMLVFGTCGILVGGLICGRLRTAGFTDANIRIGIISSLGALPFGVAAPLMADGSSALALYCAFLFFGSMPYGGAAAAFQEITPNRMRAQVTALYFFGLNLAGIGFGPTLVALFTERVFGHESDLHYALAVTTAFSAPFSALVLWRACSHYRRTLAQLTDG
jgi:MFS family permease